MSTPERCYGRSRMEIFSQTGISSRNSNRNYGYDEVNELPESKKGETNTYKSGK